MCFLKIAAVSSWILKWFLQHSFPGQSWRGCLSVWCNVISDICVCSLPIWVTLPCQSLPVGAWQDELVCMTQSALNLSANRMSLQLIQSGVGHWQSGATGHMAGSIASCSMSKWKTNVSFSCWRIVPPHPGASVEFSSKYTSTVSKRTQFWSWWMKCVVEFG